MNAEVQFGSLDSTTASHTTQRPSTCGDFWQKQPPRQSLKLRVISGFLQFVTQSYYGISKRLIARNRWKYRRGCVRFGTMSVNHISRAGMLEEVLGRLSGLATAGVGALCAAFILLLRRACRRK